MDLEYRRNKGAAGMTIHWCGTGLSSGPGLRRLLQAGLPVAVWNIDLAAARAVAGDLATDLRLYSAAALAAALRPGDLVVSMLPPDHHLALAELAVGAGAHFVCSSYISDQMRALDGAARTAGVALVNEVGLDPGIDHLMAHDLVARYRTSAAYDVANVVGFTSYCGGVPRHPNAFRYKFSWSPLGVLRALRTPSRSIRHFTELRVAHPWDAVTRYDAPLPVPETFEVYPNRDSLPFIAEYRFDPAWRLSDFVRGTLRLNGWADAWASVFAKLEALDGPDSDARLAALAEALWQGNAYAAGEPDRVVLFVSLRAERDGVAVWHQTWALDASGDLRGSAMARLVSVPVSLAVESVLAREIPAGVHAAPHDPRLVARWLEEVAHQAQTLTRIDHMA